MRLWAPRGVQPARLNHPTNAWGDRPITTHQADRPYGLRWMRVSRGRSKYLLSLTLFMVVLGVLGSGGQRDGNDNWSL
jgi:hypothetical protein